jgi:hypothetical protein
MQTQKSIPLSVLTKTLPNDFEPELLIMQSNFKAEKCAQHGGSTLTISHLCSPIAKDLVYHYEGKGK